MMKTDINDTESNQKSGTISKLGSCEVCAFTVAKYTCPRCEVKCCSLACTKIHKSELKCDGQRDHTKFIPLNKFTNLDLSSDYRLLEEATRCLDASKKKFGRRWKELPYGLIRLQNAAKSRKIDLKFLPFKFARRRNNTTMFVPKSNTIFWHVEFIFINACNLKIPVAKVDENNKLPSTLSKYILNGSDDSLNDSLQYYQSVGFAGLKLFLKAEQKPGSKFYELDPSCCLKECLERKLIIEYPTIHVVLKDHGYEYDVIDTDDEDMGVTGLVKSGKDVVSNIVRNADAENIYDSLKNLLFISEYSDEEPSSD